jgi:hypothetical protein
MKHIANLGIGLLLCLGLALEAGAQSAQNAQTQNQASASSAAQSSNSGSSLGDYARQIRKNSGAASKPKVFDNDNLPKEDKLSVVGPAPSADEQNATDANAEQSDNAGSATAKTGAPASTQPGSDQPSSQTGAGKTPEQEQAEKQAAWKQWSDRIAAQKDTVDLLTRELDVLQREYQLRAAAFYGDAGNRLRNETNWDAQDAKYKQQIADKQKTLEDAKQKLDDLQEEARKSGVPSSMREP